VCEACPHAPLELAHASKLVLEGFRLSVLAFAVDEGGACLLQTLTQLYSKNGVRGVFILRGLVTNPKVDVKHRPTPFVNKFINHQLRITSIERSLV